jgi:hypothetical protein
MFMFPGLLVVQGVEHLPTVAQCLVLVTVPLIHLGTTLGPT